MTSGADTEKRQEAVADLAAVLTSRLPDADIDGLTEQIGDVHLTTPQARAVLDHLRAHPGGLTSGSSDGPAGLERLLAALAERYPQVHRMRCANCGDVRALPYRRDEAKICGRCYGRTHLIGCARCGRQGHPRGPRPPRRRHRLHPLHQDGSGATRIVCPMRQDHSGRLPDRRRTVLSELRPTLAAHLQRLWPHQSDRPRDH